jgi:hypothetical protein
MRCLSPPPAGDWGACSCGCTGLGIDNGVGGARKLVLRIRPGGRDGIDG